VDLSRDASTPPADRRAALGHDEAMSALEHDRTYRTLDGLRGVAALMVVTRHAGQVFPANPFPESFLAVDLFFLLSGFVVAAAYEQRLRAGEPLRVFMRTRLTRLYPLYAAGLLLGVLAQLLSAATSGRAPDVLYLSQAAAIGLLMLPAVPPLPMGSSALDGPTWTLAPELLVNLVYGWLVRVLSTRAVWAIVALGAAGLVVSERVYGTLDGGWWPATFPLVAARLAFSFFLGVALFRSRRGRRRSGWAAWGALALLAAGLAVRPGAGWRELYELAMVLGVFPLIVALAVRVEPVGRSAAVFGWLGRVSYAVYVIHQPLGAIAGVGLAALQLGASWPLAAAFVGVVASLAAVLDAVYDRPARRRLSGLGRRRTAPLAPALDAVVTG
jgi:peptidoglycan/LPS O-acetylase OafA/YrhL